MINLKDNDYWIKDISLYKQGDKLIEIAEREMQGLTEIERQYIDKMPLKGSRITGCITLTKETGVLIKVLKSLGADVRWCSDNRLAISDEVSASIANFGIPVFGVRGETEEQYLECMNHALNFTDTNGNFIGPTQIIDDGCDITRYILENKPEILDVINGITEQTTCGIQEIKKIHKKQLLKTALININDSFLKKFFDNYYGIKETFVVALHNSLSVQIAGKNIVVYGYGPVGKGVLDGVRGLGGKGFLVEKDILKAVQAHMDGYEIISRDDAIEIGDVFVTATGCIDVINSKDLLKFKNNTVICNVGHGTEEYDVRFLEENESVKTEFISDHVMKYILKNGNEIYSLCEGALLNMIAAQGNPPFIMNLTFVSHLLCQIDLHLEPSKYNKNTIYEISAEMNEKIAQYSFPEIYKKIYKLNQQQRDYLGVE